LRQNGAPCARASWGATANAAAITLGTAIRADIGFVARPAWEKARVAATSEPAYWFRRELPFGRGKPVPSLLEQGRPGGYIRLTHEFSERKRAVLRPA
jgi:hypothetical protein